MGKLDSRESISHESYGLYWTEQVGISGDHQQKDNVCVVEELLSNLNILYVDEKNNTIYLRNENLEEKDPHRITIWEDFWKIFFSYK